VLWVRPQQLEATPGISIPGHEAHSADVQEATLVYQIDMIGSVRAIAALQNG